ncbi:hypothetical protein PRZ48_007433 [Zasmidium cellare]|uniref:ADP-ribosylglycohydrolase n=1 Tax=Zasmidium cellare TaxID=395010 RepID=A0ABR0EJB7_ZASCE|nr:hypothetical protein PRZ48_007433 [Zasmidium cellare]
MTGSIIPEDYLERAYAGVLGKLIGVYVGRPFEGWTHQRILKELGPIRFYVHEKVNSPLVVVDDDVSGTFVFVRALEEHGATADLSAENIGRTWLNNTVEKKSIFWWGGRGVSTEHTAYLNLKHGIKAPASGAIDTNGKTIAEQIGSQIFIDGWAMVAPGNPELAARLAHSAASVSHDGVAVDAAKLWAAMEAEAFVSANVDHLLETGLRFVQPESPLRKLVEDIRSWAKIDQDWLKTRQRIEDVYGYDKFPGHCHMMPNHGLMLMALVYGRDFHEAIHIINTAGWDTDCNSGNIGCLFAIMNGLSAFESGPDWRGPLADRALISSSDGGYSINNAARIAYDLVNTGRKLGGRKALPAPKDGSQFHFTLPGSVQGFVTSPNSLLPRLVHIQQAIDAHGRAGLAIDLDGLTNATEPVEVMTDTFSPPDVRQMKKTYDLMAAPLIYPGQVLKAVVRSDTSTNVSVSVQLRLKHYSVQDVLATLDGPSAVLAPGQEQTISWKIPDVLDSQPIQNIGVALSCVAGCFKGRIWLDSVSYSGTPEMTLKRPAALAQLSKEATRNLFGFWHRAWIHNLHNLTVRFPSMSFSLAQDEGEGIMTTGTRDWADYRLSAPRFQVTLGSAGLAVRVQGLNRYYALILQSGGQRVALLKARDEVRTVLSSVEYAWKLDEIYSVSLVANADTLTGYIAGQKIVEVHDAEYVNGGIGAVVADGSLSIDQFDVAPL